MVKPSVEVEAAFLGEVTEHVRRVDIYQADGKTLWKSNVALQSGSISIDYDRDERRSIDISFDNSNGDLTYDPNGFWYDKIIKPYRGVEYDAHVVDQVVTMTNLLYNPSFETNVSNWTTSKCTITRDPDWKKSGEYSGRVNVTDASPYIYAYGEGARVGPIANGVYFSSKVTVKALRPVRIRSSIIYYDINKAGAGTAANYHVDYDLNTGDVQTIQYIDALCDNPNAAYFLNVLYFRNLGTDTPMTATGDVVQVDQACAYVHGTQPSNWTVVPYADGDMSAARWTGAPHASATQVIKNVESVERSFWETQIGEFMIDKITEPNFPPIIKVTGRDWTKKMLGSKFITATSFNQGASLDAVINAIASNAGIDAQKRLIPFTGITLSKDFFFESGTSRWEACKTLADTYNFELFFDAQGYLVMRQYQDPSTSQLSYTFETGMYGNLANYDKTVNDSRLYNHVVVTGEASDTIPVYADARNDNPASPTNIALIGDRLYQYTSSFITTTAQALDVAKTFLSIHSLQEFELNFGSLLLPWMEVGEIIEFLDPNAYSTQPDRFLLSTLTIPLGLDLMSGTGKRVTVLK